MRTAIIIDRETRPQKSLTEALRDVDPNLKVECFSDLKQLTYFLAEKMDLPPPGTEGVAEEDVKPEISLVIADQDFVGTRFTSLLPRTRDYLIRHGFSTALKPTHFLMTAYEGPEFDIRPLRLSIAENLVFKPFDPALLRQVLLKILQANATPDAAESFLYTQKTKAEVEMVKEVELENMSEIGFATRSSRRIGAGEISKYRFPFLKDLESKSFHARHIISRNHPHIPGTFLCYFTFFGIQRAILNEARKLASSQNQGETASLLTINPALSPAPKVVVVDDDEKSRADILVAMKNLLPAFDVVEVSHIQELWMELLSPIEYELGEQVLAGVAKDVSRLRSLTYEMDRNRLEQFLQLNQTGVETPPCPVRLKKPDSESWVIIEISPWNEAEGLFPIRVLQKEEASEVMGHYRRIPEKPDVLIIDERFLGSSPGARIKMLSEHCSRIILIGDDLPQWQPEWTHNAVCDFQLRPVDRLDLAKKIAFFVPHPLSTRIREGIQQRAIRRIAHVTRPVKVESVSEAGLSIVYSRAIDVGRFRFFSFTFPNKGNITRVLARCVYTTAIEETGQFRCDFTYFGVTDAELRSLRNWIREYYITEKEKSE